MNIRKLQTKIAIISVIVVPIVLLSSVSLGMAMRADGTMSNCLFGHDMGFCPMSLFEHIDVWQSMFIVILPVIVIFSSLLLNSFFTFLNKELIVFIKLLLKLYQKYKPDIPLFDYLKELFSQGILNPKIYALAIT